MLASSAGGRGRLVALVGEPGIGKTRLAEEIARIAEERGAIACWGRAWEAGGAPPYWQWISILRMLLTGLGDDRPDVVGDRSDDLAPLLPELAGGAPSGSLDPEQARFALFEAVADTVSAAAARRPVVLILDDAHAADEPALQLLRFLGSRIWDVGLLVVVTYREMESRVNETVGQLLAEVARLGTRIVLRGLTPPSIASVVEAVTGVRPREPLVQTLHEATGGNPLFLHETARLLGDRAGDESLDIAAIGVPEGVRNVIRQRVSLLSEGSVAALATAATIGRDFDMTLLRRVLGDETDQVMRHLDEAQRAGVVTTISEAALHFRFAHELYREWLIEMLPRDERLRLHLSVASALEEHHRADLSPQVSVLAHHYVRSASIGDPEKAVGYADEAGRMARASHAYEAASARFAEALEVSSLIADFDPRRRCELLLALGGASMNSGRTAAARESALAAAELARKLGDPGLLARAASSYGEASFEAGTTDATLIGLLEEALEGLGGEDTSLRVDMLTRLAIELYYTPEEERRRALSDEAVHIARRLDDPTALSYALESAAISSAGPDNVEQRLANGTEVVELLEREEGRETGELSGRIHVILAQAELGDAVAFDRELGAYEAQADAIRHPSHLWYGRALRAARVLQEGRFEEAERLGDEALTIGETGREAEARQHAWAQRYLLHVESGRREPQEVLAELNALADKHPTLPFFRAAAGHVAVADRRVAEARIDFDRLAADDFRLIPRNLSWLGTLATLAEVAIAIGDEERAAGLLALLEPYGDRHVVVDWGMAFLGSTRRWLGGLSILLGDHGAAVEHLEAAREADARWGALPAVAQDERLLGRALLGRDAPGDRERAIGFLSRAVESFEALGMHHHERDARMSLEDIGAGGGAAQDVEGERPAVFRREGEYWAVSFEGDSFRLKHTKGLTYLSELLGRPGQEVHALELSGAAAGDGRPARKAEPGLEAGDLGDAGAALDPEAKAAYRKRIQELEEEIAEAEEWSDPERAARAREERDFVAKEISAAVGLGGRDRKAASAAERARVAVTRAIKSALKRVEEHSAALARHLNTTVKTGTFCSYTPDPRAPIIWRR